MTTIYCTNKLKEFFGLKKFPIADNSSENFIGNWNGHLFYLNRRKFLIFVNNKSYYSIIIADIKKSDLKNCDMLFLNRLTEQLVYDTSIENSDILIILQKLIPLQFSKTNNDKKTLGTINEFIFQFKCNYDSVFWKGQSLMEINKLINGSLTGAGKNKNRDYGVPIEDMRELINDNSDNRSLLF